MSTVFPSQEHFHILNRDHSHNFARCVLLLYYANEILKFRTIDFLARVHRPSKQQS